MPYAPQYQPGQQRDPQVEGGFVAANDGGGVAGGIAQGAQELGRAAGQFANDMNDVANVRASRVARERALAYRKEAAALEQEFKSLRGMNTVYDGPSYDERLKELGDKYRGSINDGRTSRFFGEMIDPYEAQVGQSMTAHQIAEERSAYEGTLDGEMLEAQENAKNSYGNPQAMTGYLSDVRSTLSEMREHYGWDDDEYQAKTRLALSDVHDGAIDAMLAQPNSDLDLVTAYFAANEDEMTSAARNSALKKIQGPLETRQANADFLEVVSGVSPPTADDAGGSAQAPGTSSRQMPVSGRATSNFDAHTRRGSAGYDIAAPAGTSILPAAEGVVEEVGTGRTGGNFIRVRHPDGTLTSYMHMENRPRFEKGDRVTPSTVIGTVGTTGRSSGPHLHLEVKDASGRQIDPEAYLNGASTVGSTVAPREWDRASVMAGIDEKVNSGEWTFERGERARAFASRRMDQDESLLRDQQNDAYEAAQQFLLEQGDDFRFDNLPSSIKDNLAPGNALTLKNVDKSLRGGTAGKANGPVYTSMDLLSVENPVAFANTDLTSVAGSMTPGEFRTLAKRQVDARQKQNEWTPHTEVNSAFNRMTMLDDEKFSDKDKVAIKTLMIEAAYRLREQNGGKPLTDKDYNEAYRFALGNVQTVSSFGPFSNTFEQPRYQASDRVERSREFVEGVEEVSRSRASAELQRRRKRVIDTFRQEFKRAPTEAEIVHYLQFTP